MADDLFHRRNDDPTSNFSDDLVLVVPCLLIISKFRPWPLIPFSSLQQSFMSAVACVCVRALSADVSIFKSVGF